MFLRVPRSVCAAAATMAAAAYALPLSMSVVTYVVHDAYHLRHHEGVVATAGAERPDPEAGGFVHAHGGAAHSHGVATDALLGAAQDEGDAGAEHVAPSTELAGHVPANAEALSFGLTPSLAPRFDPTAWLPLSAAPPPLPPPRT